MQGRVGACFEQETTKGRKKGWKRGNTGTEAGNAGGTCDTLWQHGQHGGHCSGGQVKVDDRKKREVKFMEENRTGRRRYRGDLSRVGQATGAEMGDETDLFAGGGTDGSCPSGNVRSQMSSS